MKVDISLLLLAASTFATAFPHPVTDALENQETPSLKTRDAFSLAWGEVQDLWKRKGGGGGGGKGSGSSSSSSSSSGSSSGSGSSGSRPAGSSSSSSGGKTSTGSGVTPSYGGRYYSGGASVPYTSGSRTPSGLLPVAILGVGALAIFPGLWANPAYIYPYSHPYTFYNASSSQNETKPVDCLCEQYQVCGCDDNNNATFLNDLVGNGSYAAQDDSINVADYNGTSTILINGTLANGTTAADASSSTSNSSTSSSSTSSSASHTIPSSSITRILETSGYWVMAVLVGGMVMLA